MWKFIQPRPGNLRAWQLGLLLAVFGLWHLLTTPGLIPPFMFENEQQAAFFFGEPLKIFGRIWNWFFANADIYEHLWVTLLETVLAFGIGTTLGLGAGLWLGLSPLAAAICDPYIKALNSMPRVILAPIFAVWFGLGLASKVALGVTLASAQIDPERQTELVPRVCAAADELSELLNYRPQSSAQVLSITSRRAGGGHA